MTPVSAPSNSTTHEEPWPENRAMFDRLVARHEPTVFRGLAADWLPSGATSDLAILDWLEGLLKDRVVPVSVGLPADAGFMGATQVAGGRSLRTTLSGERPFSVVAGDMRRELRLRTGHALYVHSVEVDEVIPELRPFLRLPLHGSLPTGHWRAWIGTGDHRVGLHYDGEENLFCLLTGRKRFNIAPFDVLRDVYVGPLNGPFGPPASLVDPVRPDVTKHPRFAKVQEHLTSVELEAGDVLYLPAHWWHYVDSFGFNVAANHWWSDLSPHAKATGDLMFLNALLTIRTLPAHWREFWQEMFGYFVFLLDGDPYEHLAVPDQGLAGTPTPARTDAIRRAIVALEHQVWSQSIRTAELPAQPFKVAPTLHLRIRSHDSVILRDSERGMERAADIQLVSILARFAEPQTPQQAIFALKQAGFHDDESKISDAIRELVVNRMLVPCEELSEPVTTVMTIG